MNAVTWCMDRRIVAGSIAFWNTTTGKWLKHSQFGREDTLGISGFCAMSRCFPFPPPGYEGKSRTDDVDLLKKVNTIFLYCANCLTCHYLECKTGFLCELSVKCAWIRFIFHVAKLKARLPMTPTFHWIPSRRKLWSTGLSWHWNGF